MQARDNSSSSVDRMVEAVEAGDRVALARAITLVESVKPEDQVRAQALLDRLLPLTGNAIRVGISGVPGAGKSTLIDQLGFNLVAQGHKVAVLAVDPTSSKSGGSILGDKTRMGRLATETGAFIRPSPAGDSLGGVTKTTRETIALVEAAGYDVVLVETVGVGQSEMAVANMVDVFMVVALPGAGDELQGIKRGLLELADIIAVNKADGDNIHRAERAALNIAPGCISLPPATPTGRRGAHGFGAGEHRSRRVVAEGRGATGGACVLRRARQAAQRSGRGLDARAVRAKAARGLPRQPPRRPPLERDGSKGPGRRDDADGGGGRTRPSRRDRAAAAGLAATGEFPFLTGAPLVSRAMVQTKVLLTGFGPFPGAPENPSAWLAETLASSPLARRPEVSLHAEVLPTEWAAVSARAPRLLETLKPQLILHFGLSRRARSFRIERSAHNRILPRADAAGALPGRGSHPRRARPARLLFPADRLAAHLRQNGVAAAASRSAGRYLCNFLYYLSLDWARRQPTPCHAVFVHIPLAAPQGGPLHQAELLRGAEAALAFALAVNATKVAAE